MNIKEQFRIIRNPKNEEDTAVPVMPILVVLQDGTVGEARTVRGAVAIIAGNQYFDCEDEIDEWNFRVELARKECMKAIAQDIYAITYSDKMGIIKENYAADPGDPDYDINSCDPPIRVYVDTDRAFLLSLARLGAITIIEIEGSSILTDWRKDVQSCSHCIYKVSSGDSFKCEVYNCIVDGCAGSNCSAYYNQDIAAASRLGNEYINIANSYNLDELIPKAAIL